MPFDTWWQQQRHCQRLTSRYMVKTTTGLSHSGNNNGATRSQLPLFHRGNCRKSLVVATWWKRCSSGLWAPQPVCTLGKSCHRCNASCTQDMQSFSIPCSLLSTIDCTQTVGKEREWGVQITQNTFIRCGAYHVKGMFACESQCWFTQRPPQNYKVDLATTFQD